MTELQNELLEEVTKQIHDFIKETPAIVVAMARGYKVELSFNLERLDKNELKLESSVLHRDGGGSLTFEELFKLNPSAN